MKTMIDLEQDDKRLILHAAYYAVVAHDWRDHVFRSDIKDDVKKHLIGKFPCGDPMNNLMNLADRLLPDFDGNKTINENWEMVKKFVYGDSPA